MFQIGSPLYFWGLLGLIIPILIHLYNKRKTKVKILGSLRWITEIQPAQWHFKHVHQWPLLFIRMLLILFALLLVVDFQKTVPSDTQSNIPNLILVHPSAGDTLQFRQLAAGWENDSVKVRWLQPDLPALEEQANPDLLYSIWSLIAEADFHFQPAKIHVIAANRFDYFDGSIPPLNASLSWELVESKKDTLQLLDVNQVKGDKYELLWYHSKPEKSVYNLHQKNESTIPEHPLVVWDQERKNVLTGTSRNQYQVPVRIQDTLKIIGYHSDKDPEWSLLQKALQATGDFHNIPVIAVNDPLKAQWHFWLNQDSVENIDFDNPFLKFFYHPGQSVQWLEPVAHKTIKIRKALTTGNILEGGMLEELRPYFLEFKYKNVLKPEVDVRHVELPDITSDKNSYKKVSAGSEPSSEFRMWIGFILLGLIIIERLWPKGIK